MLRSNVLIMAALLTLLAAACGPIPAAAPTPAPIKTEEPSIPVTGVAVVQSVEIQVLESLPLQVNAIVRGQLPDAGCTTISSVNQVRNDNTINVTLTTTTDPLALCAQALTPFEQVVSLDISNLPPATYTVDVQGVQQTFELPAQNTSVFQQALVNALNARDYEALQAMMHESFMLAYWQSEGTAYTPELAVKQLKLNLLNGSSPITVDPDKDLTALLGVDPVTIAGPEITEVSPLFVGSLGAEGRDEAILFIAKLPDGRLYWYGMLFAKDGFAKSGTIVIDPVDENTFSTGVRYVMAQQDVQVYNGPGTSYTVIGQVFSGQIAQVTGTNVHGSWWRIICPDDSAGSCWVSGDPALTQPTTAPHDNQPPPPGDPQSTNVQYVIAEQDVPIYGGPADQYNVIGSIASGQTAKVTGISADGSWWRVMCPDDTAGNCWVSANPAYTNPAQARR